MMRKEDIGGGGHESSSTREASLKAILDMWRGRATVEEEATGTETRNKSIIWREKLCWT